MTHQDEPNPPPHDDAAQHRHVAMRDAEPPDGEPRAEVIARIDAALRGQLTAEHRAMCERELVRLLAMDDAFSVAAVRALARRSGGVYGEVLFNAADEIERHQLHSAVSIQDAWGIGRKHAGDALCAIADAQMKTWAKFPSSEGPRDFIAEAIVNALREMGVVKDAA